MNHYLVETISLVKKQYLVEASDMIEAQDKVTMQEVRFYDKVDLGETIVSSQITSFDSGFSCADPVKAAKIEAKKVMDAENGIFAGNM